MKKLNLIFLFIFTGLITFTSCDELSQLTLNVPLPIEFSAVGSNTTVTESEFFCLSSYKEWRDNQEDIESAKYLAASYWTLEGSSPNLEGDVSFTLSSGGSEIFTYPLGRIKADDYIDSAYVFDLNENQINALNDILTFLTDMNNDICFTGVLNVENITGQTNASGNYVLNGKVEIVLETEVNTD
jgi:hypothetical protein